jgi:drug/metabolite transporter (DMT)-like permease
VRAIILVLVSLSLGVAGLLLWRHAIAGVGGFTLGANGTLGQLWALLGHWAFWTGNLLLVGVALISLELYGNDALSTVIPLYSVGYVLVALVDRFALGQPVPLGRWVGIGFILVGVVFVIRSTVPEDAPTEPPGAAAERLP